MKRSSVHPWFGLAALALALAAGCGGDDEGKPTGATCPTGSALTYGTFGKTFMTNYCTRCHASDRKGAARQGAPSDHDFDNLPAIQGLADHIGEHAAAGPSATNTDMPPGDPRPTLEERKQLGEWLACGAP